MRLLLPAVGVALACSLCHAQCEGQWLPGQATWWVEGSVVYATTTWDPDGPGAEPARLVVGGSFFRIGGVSARNVAMWDGSTWHPLGSGVEPPITSSPTVGALAVYNGELIAGGHFTTAGASVVNHIARWDGTQWRPLGSGLSGGLLPFVSALGVYGGELIVGGTFTSAGGVPANGIARWNGSTWAPLGGGMSGVGAYAFAVYGGDLIVGGNFSAAGGLPANNIARWNGSMWQTMGSGANSSVVDFVVNGNDLFACGYFTSPGNRVARWDGTTWTPFGAGLDAYVRTITLYGGDLVAGGDFTASGSTPVRRIARWNGAMWQPLGTGMSGGLGSGGVVGELLEYGGDLVAAGYFTVAGGIASPYLARWRNDPAPWITTQPSSVTTACQAVLSVTTGGASPGLQHLWRRAGVPLADGPTGTGSVVSGATTGELRISAVTSADAGSYDCVVSNACGSATSESAALVFGDCVADADCNGVIDPTDVANFVVEWFASREGGTLAGDFDGNGIVEPVDIAGFVTAWMAALAGGGC